MYKRFVYTLITLLFIFSFGGVLFYVQAEDALNDVEIEDTATSDDTPAINRRIEIKKEVREAREENVQKREELRSEVTKKREEERAEFKQRLQEIQDEKKQEIVERIDTHINTINSRWLNHWQNVVDRLSKLLNKIESRTDLAEENGQDVSTLRDAIEAATGAIEDVQIALNTQSEKDYVINITNETGLGEDIQATKTQLRSDLSEIRTLIEVARDAVRDALVALKDIPNIDSFDRPESNN